MTEESIIYEQYPLLSAVLAERLGRAERLGIHTESEFETLPVPLLIAEREFAELVTALIDCGIASCRKMEDPEEKWISPRMYARVGALHAECAAGGDPVDLTDVRRKAQACGGWIQVDQYDDSYNLHFEIHKYFIILVDPLAKEKEEMAKLIRESLPGQVNIRHYSDAGDCPAEELRRCNAIFITLNSVEDVVAAYTLHPHGVKWPLVVVTNHERFGLEAHALWARSFLLRPVTTQQVGEALRRCMDVENPSWNKKIFSQSAQTGISFLEEERL